MSLYGYFYVKVEKRDPVTEQWQYHMGATARKINRAGGSESFAAGAEQFHRRLAFTFPYVIAWRDIVRNPQLYRLVYDGVTYNIIGDDDYMEQHRELTLVGVAYV